MLNPLAAILEQFRHAVIDPARADARPRRPAAARGCWSRSAILVGVVALGYRVFDREAPRIAEEL